MPSSARLIPLLSAILTACSATPEPSASPPSPTTASETDGGRRQVFFEVIITQVDPDRFHPVPHMGLSPPHEDVGTPPTPPPGDLMSVFLDSRGQPVPGVEVLSTPHILAPEGMHTTIDTGSDVDTFHLDLLAQIRPRDIIHCDISIHDSLANVQTTVDMGNGQWMILGRPEQGVPKKTIIAFKSTIIRTKDDLERIFRDKAQRKPQGSVPPSGNGGSWMAPAPVSRAP